ncbi:rubredoxin [bacterium]|nr:rubredoxin [bacterium]
MTVKDPKTKYRCTVCGYIYNPEWGDAESDVEPGTAFDDLPRDWLCPICGVTTQLFFPEE